MSNIRSILVVDDDMELAGALSEQLALHEEFEPRPSTRRPRLSPP